MREPEKRAEPLKFLSRSARSVFPRGTEFAQHVQIELREHLQSALLAVGFHLALKQFVFPHRLIREFARNEIDKDACPSVSQSDGRAALGEHFLRVHLMHDLTCLLAVACVERDPDFAAGKNAINPKHAVAFPLRRSASLAEILAGFLVPTIKRESHERILLPNFKSGLVKRE